MTARSLLTALLLPLMFLCLASPQAQAQSNPPASVIDALEAAPSPTSPRKVIVGAYINDIQQLDFKTNHYAIDLYVWFRWKGDETDPSKTMEFMNRYAADENLREQLYGKPEPMPDGSLYSIIRYEGRFSTAFALEKYPLDEQTLTVVMEDTVSGTDAQVYVADAEPSISVNPAITLPGFRIGKPSLRVAEHTYPTNFGDISKPKTDTYSRISISVPVTRPVVAMSVKTFVPILLIVVCAALVFFVRPRYVEGRIGLGITALLTLVALQLTSGASLPDVDYLMMLDKMFLLAYLFIIVALGRVVATSWSGADADAEATIKRKDRGWAAGLVAAYLVANLAVAWTAIA